MDFGIKGRGIETPMPQQLTDLLQRSSLMEHLGGQGVSEQMGTGAGRLHAGSFERAGDKGGDSDGVGESLEWGSQANENASAGAGRTSLFQVTGQCFTDVMGQREFGSAGPFPLNGEFCCIPIDIVQCEGDDFASPNAEPGQQEQDGVIALSLRRLTIAMIQDALDLTGS
jgi:hypothetical protein